MSGKNPLRECCNRPPVFPLAFRQFPTRVHINFHLFKPLSSPCQLERLFPSFCKQQARRMQRAYRDRSSMRTPIHTLCVSPLPIYFQKKCSWHLPLQISASLECSSTPVWGSRMERTSELTASAVQWDVACEQKVAEYPLRRAARKSPSCLMACTLCLLHLPLLS